MGMEDREWYRDELRQKGKKPSWDNFNAGAKAQPSDAGVATGEVVRIARPLKTSTPPSYVHLQAQQILDERAEAQKSSLWPVYGVFIFAFAMVAYVVSLYIGS